VIVVGNIGSWSVERDKEEKRERVTFSSEVKSLLINHHGNKEF
jgi:hypothetical protein